MACTGARVKIMRHIEFGRKKTAGGKAVNTPLLPQGIPAAPAGPRNDLVHPTTTTSDFQTTVRPELLPGMHAGTPNLGGPHTK